MDNFSDYVASGKVIPTNIEDEMKESYIDYSMSVIIGRALPDVRDGLKPVHRRILYALNDLGMHHDKPYKKSARVVGEIIGKYHPHGDVAVYDALVRMVQDFSLRYPLVDGQGNFGSVDGDAAAAMRYSECRMAKIAEEMLADIDKETVDFVPNFDESLEEPTVLPSKIPNLLVNGSSGIAVGMATNMAPHNLSEVVDGTVAVIDNPQISIEELLQYVRGPDFPTGGIIQGRSGIIQAYKEGRGSVRIRAKAEILDEKNKQKIIITEIPYQVNKATLVENIADLVKEKRVEGVTDLRDESDREGIRVVIELKSGIQGDIVLNQLYKHTSLESAFGIINLALVDNKPEVLDLKSLITLFIDHRRDVITKRCQFELKKSEARAHILEGLKKAIQHIDDVIKIIRGSKTPEEAKTGLEKKFSLSQEQSQAILEMRLQKLTSLERGKIDEEHEQLLKTIAWLKEVLASEAKILEIIKKELLEIKQKYGDERRTQIAEGGEDLEIEDLIAEEQMVVSITNQGYIKRLPTETYRAQRRGGRGVIGMETKEEDFVEELFVASTHDYVLFFTNMGKVYWLKVYQLPVEGRYARGKAIVNLIELEKEERITASVRVSEFRDDLYLVALTKNGLIKKTELSAYSRPRKGGIIAINLKEKDELVDVKLTTGKDDILIATKNGKSIRFKETDVRPVGRASQGVTGVRLKKDEVVGMVVAKEGEALLTITENGYGKRSEFSKYPVQRRAGQGVIDIKTTDRNGKVVSVKSVKEEEDIMVITSDGVIIRTPVSTISEIGRNTQGVRIMKLDEGKKVVSLAKMAKDENGDDEDDPSDTPDDKPKADSPPPQEQEPVFKEIEENPTPGESTFYGKVERVGKVLHLRKPGM
ncbi:MAG: DNA gyrase subunit A [Candidatus Altiarchaeota archaeon]|nr:DNA gyrase subunit A [Candidatus Altiarchaeota archaeon]